MLCVLPPDAVMVSEDVPDGVEELVVIVSVTVPPPLTLAGVKVAVAPEGRPLALKDTALLKPFSGVTVMAQLTEPPAFTVNGEPQLEDNEKSGFAESRPNTLIRLENDPR